MTDSETEIERLKARITAIERILRIEAIQATGDAVDQWWEVVHDDNSTAAAIEAAGMEAAKEVLATKNKERHEGHMTGTKRRALPV